MKTYVYRSERNRSISDDLHDYQEPERGGKRGGPYTWMDFNGHHYEWMDECGANNYDGWMNA
jgi:hypothetical protein